MKRIIVIGASAAVLLFISVLLCIPQEDLPEQDKTKSESENETVAREKAPVPELMSKAAVLYDFETGKLLFEKNGNLSISPASMTKLMTLHLVYKAIEEGELSRNTEVDISERADFRNQPAGSSLMFIEEGQRVTILELMQGLAVPSGNDAAVALAEAVSGSLEDFVEEMNREAVRLELEEVEFVEPAGIDSSNKATARSFARFCRIYLQTHPYALEELHSLEEYTYPNGWNLPSASSSVHGPITQENYNLLVGRHPWVDGLKTGYISEAGYNIALTAKHGKRRVLAVVLGGPGENTREGNLSRVIDGTHLISYGFYAYRRVHPSVPDVGTVKVWGGRTSSLELEVPEPDPLIVSSEKVDTLRSSAVVDEPLEAPIQEGEVVGKVLVSSGSENLREYPISASRTVEEGGALRRAWDSLRVRLSEF